jgi:hypothetical protein
MDGPVATAGLSKKIAECHIVCDEGNCSIRLPKLNNCLSTHALSMKGPDYSPNIAFKFSVPRCLFFLDCLPIDRN